ncbi:MAG: glycosyltransferase family 25 protein [Pirellulaceae bacterium]
MRAFLISLPEDSTRRQSGLSKIRAAGIAYEISDGVEAKKWTADALRQACVPGSRLKPGEVGCYLAHLRTMQRIVEYDLPWAVVIEDDFCYEAEPDFGLAEIGNFLPKEFDYIHLQRDWGWNRRLRVSPHCQWFERIHGTPLGTTGYIVANRFCRVMLRNFSRCEMAIDQLLSRASETHMFFRTRKPIVGIQEGLGTVIHDE